MDNSTRQLNRADDALDAAFDAGWDDRQTGSVLDPRTDNKALRAAYLSGFESAPVAQLTGYAAVEACHQCDRFYAQGDVAARNVLLATIAPDMRNGRELLDEEDV